MAKLPDPKTLVDSIADGVVEVATGPTRVADNVSAVANKHAKDMHANLDNLKARMPDDLSVIPDTAIKTVGQTVEAGLGIFEGIGKGIMDTFSGIKGQINRVTR